MMIKGALEILKRNVYKIIPETGLSEKLETSVSRKKPLIVKLGADPSAPDIHFGHLVVLKKLRDFQRQGHKIVFIIGDFTAMIGDPTGKNETRPRLSRDQAAANADTYAKQIFKVLDRDRTDIRFNSEWFEKINVYQFLDITSKYTVARMLERNDFAERFKKESPISILEFLYPLVQGYDSVAIKADIELGGTDQEFNLIVGRILQERYGLEPQTALIMPIIEGLDGKQKMSKSLGNYIGINDGPKDMFGKIMSVPDEILPKYIGLLSEKEERMKSEIVDALQKGTVNPRDPKMEFAREMTEWLCGKEDAATAENDFITRFVKKGIPEDIPEISAAPDTITNIIAAFAKDMSKGEIKRLIIQNAVFFESEKVTDQGMKISASGIIRAGKRIIFRVRIEE